MIYFKNIELPPLDPIAAAGYAGAGKRATPEELALVERAYRELLPELSGRVCYTELSVTHIDGGVLLGDVELRSLSLAERLRDCSRAVVFAATVGLGPDRLIAKYSRVSSALSLAVSAVGSERVEALADAFCDLISAERLSQSCRTVERFSPGYGDLPLEVQKSIFELLSPGRYIGVMLGESLIMTPSKSVTAIVGIKARGD